MTREEIISGLKFTIEMFLFNPSTGEYTEPRNEDDRTTIDACRGAIELLEREPVLDKIRAEIKAMFPPSGAWMYEEGHEVEHTVCEVLSDVLQIIDELTLCIADVERDVSMKNLSPKEALKILDDMKVKIEIPKAAVTQWERNTALDMAIEALNSSENPNSDALDKIKAEVEALEEGITSYHNDRPWIFKDEVLQIIDKYNAASEE